MTPTFFHYTANAAWPDVFNSGPGSFTMHPRCMFCEALQAFILLRGCCSCLLLFLCTHVFVLTGCQSSEEGLSGMPACETYE